MELIKEGYIGIDWNIEQNEMKGERELDGCRQVSPLQDVASTATVLGFGR